MEEPNVVPVEEYQKSGNPLPWQKKYMPVFLVMTILAINSSISPLTVGHYLGKRLHHEEESETYFGTILSISYAGSFFGGILADNYFGRYRMTLLSLGILSSAFLLTGIGAIPPVKSSQLDVSSLLLGAAAAGFLRSSYLPLLGDQTRTDKHRILAFSAVFPAYSLGYIIAYRFYLSMEYIECAGNNHCYVAPFFTAAMVCILISIFFVAFQSHLTKQVTLRGNVLSAVWQLARYALSVKLETRGSAKGVGKGRSFLEYARELDRKVAEDLIRIGKTLFLIWVCTMFYFHLISFYDFGWTQAGKMNLFRNFGVTLLQNDHFATFSIANFASGTMLFIFLLFWPRKFQVVGAMIAATSIMVASTGATIGLEFYVRNSEPGLDPGRRITALTNDLPCLVNVTMKNGSQAITVVSGEAKIIESAGNAMSIEFGDACINNETFTRGNVNFEHFKKTGIFMQLKLSENGSVLIKKQEFDGTKPPDAALVVSLDENLKVFCSRKMVKKRSKDFNWYILQPSPTGSNIFRLSSSTKTKTGGPRDDYFLETEMGAVYGVTADKNNSFRVLHILPGFFVSGSWQFIPMFLESLSENLVFVLIYEFTYTQAPAHMRAMLHGLILTSIFLSKFMKFVLDEVILLISADSLSNLAVASVLAVAAMIFGAWRLQKHGMHNAEPVQEKYEDDSKNLES